MKNNAHTKYATIIWRIIKFFYNKNVFSKLQGGFMTNTICKTMISIAIIIAMIVAININKSMEPLWALLLIVPIWSKYF